MKPNISRAIRSIGQPKWAKAFAGLVMLLFLSALAGCAAGLTPNYDHAFYERLLAADSKTSKLFSTIETNGLTSDFDAMDKDYGNVLGELNSLHLLATSRPLPVNLQKLERFEAVKTICGSEVDLAECLNDTPGKLKEIIIIVEKTRDTHKLRGIKKQIAKGFAQSYRGLMHQVLVYEGFLNYQR